jgi:hypothetical protein
MIREARTLERGEKLVTEHEIPRVREVIGKILLGVLRVGQQILSARDEVELIHGTPIDGLHRGLVGMVDIVRRDIRGRTERDHRARGQYASRRAVHAGERAEIVVERPVFLDDEDDVLDLEQAPLMVVIDAPLLLVAVGLLPQHQPAGRTANRDQARDDRRVTRSSGS